nr:MAG TPA: hypothetical protein [Caudoviricetes sp.]
MYNMCLIKTTIYKLCKNGINHYLGYITVSISQHYLSKFRL